MKAAGENSQDVESLITTLTSFQEKAQIIDYDAELIAERNQQMKESETLAAAALQGKMEDLDSQFYQENTVFEDLAEEYNTLNSVITPSYRIDTIEEVQGEALLVPERILVTDNGYLYAALRPDAFAIKRLKERLSLDGSDVPSADATEAVLLAFDPERKFVGAILLPSDFCWDNGRNSRLYTYSPGDKELQVWEGGLIPVQSIPIPGLSRTSPLRMDITVSDEDIIYLFLDNDVHVFSSQYDPLLEDYPFRYTDLEEGLNKTLSSLPWEPTSWQAEKTDKIHISDGGNSRILVVSPSGDIQREISLGDAVEGSSFWIDSFGYYYVCDPMNHQIRKYTPQGAFFTTMGKYGTEEGAFSRPQSGAMDQGGTLYIADSYNNRIQIFRPQRSPLGLPEIAKLHLSLLRRIERSKEGERNINSLKKLDQENNIFSLTLGGSLLTAGIVGPLVGFDVFSYLTADSYNDYLSATDIEAVKKTRESIEGYKTLGRASLFASIPFITVGTAILVDGLLSTARKLHVRPLGYKNVQNQDLDLLYSLDEKDYRSPQIALALGLGASLLPGVLSVGLSTVEIILLLNDEDVNNFSNPLHYVNMALIGIPPIGAHLYGGRLSITLSIASLVGGPLGRGGLSLLQGCSLSNACSETGGLF